MWIRKEENGQKQAQVNSSRSRGGRPRGEITLPPNLTEIDMEAFTQCTSLSVITLPAGPVHVDVGAFRNCPGTPRRPSD